MRESSVKLALIFTISLLTVPFSVAIVTDTNDSYAETEDFSKYYYNQLTTDLARNIYDGIVGLTDHDMKDEVILTTSDLNAVSSAPNDRTPENVRAFINEQRGLAIAAVSYDNPKATYFISDLGTKGNVVMSGNPIKSVTMTIQYQKLDHCVSKAVCDSEIASALTAMDGGIDKTDDAAKVTSIHRIVVKKLTYDTVNMDSQDNETSKRIRSLYTSAAGDHNVVCEGYAKLFKALCDLNDVPCIIVVGDSKDSSGDDPRGHMWNYVRVGEMWYLVDCTWDDQKTMSTKYLMAGTETDGFNIKVKDSHDPSGMDFKLPTLSALSYSDAPAGTQYLVTFISNGVTYRTEYVVKGGHITSPPVPTDGQIGDNFVGWYTDDPDTLWNFYDGTVTSDTTLTAKWSSNPVWVLTYTTNGTAIPLVVVEKGNSVTVTGTTPVRDGHTFLGWNTSPNGDGLSFEGGKEITLASDLTLYAIWYSDSDSLMDSMIEDMATFFNGKTVDGVKNGTLTIILLTALIGIVTVGVIYRK